MLATLMVATAALPSPSALFAQSKTRATIQEKDLREWLTYLSSDELQGRQLFTEGYGNATQFVAERLREMGVKPMGDNGTYFQIVKQKGYRITNNSSVTVEASGKPPVTFKNGEGVNFTTNVGGPQTLTFNGVEFVGYGIAMADPPHNDYKGRDAKGKLVVWMGAGPATLTGANRVLGARSRYAIETMGAKAALGFAPAAAPMTPAEVALAEAQAALQQANAAVAQAQAALMQARTGRGGRGGAGGRGGRGGAPAVQADLTTVQRVDNLVIPQITGDERLFEAIFAGAPTNFAALKAASDKGDPLPTFSVPGVKVTLNVNNTYEVISTQLTKNVVGMVEGIDPVLKKTYVMFGAHLDHVGYRTAAPAPGGRAGGAAATPGREPDLIFNGADDDGSGSTGLLGIAKAFATGPKPKRSVIFVWHSGEESGLQGSRYMADFPVVPMDAIQAQFNIDMIGRNRDDLPGEASTVYVIGADRISTDLHNVVVDANLGTREPLQLNYEYNDPRDPNSFYTRSDHYSYASKGIPIAFFFTGTHPDYHGAGDTVDKIIFPKMQRITQMVYEAGFNVANSEKSLVRDNLGPRTGKGFSGKIGGK
ncbi:MAG TPA: M28 family peptidase [Vicinamibacterales bacterium]|nr:M28 family peptidase [Vicinamibacterales bacterium]